MLCDRVVDLIWRLSNLAIKAALERDFSGKKFAALPSFEHVSTADALLAVKVCAAMARVDDTHECHLLDSVSYLPLSGKDCDEDTVAEEEEHRAMPRSGRVGRVRCNADREDP